MEMNREPDEPESFSVARRFGVGANVVLSVALMLAVVVMVNYVSARHYRRTNLNRADPAELSAETRGLLQTLTNDVRVIALFEGDDALFRHVWLLLREYENINPRVRVEHVDYLRDPATAQALKSEFDLNHLADRSLVIFSQGGRNKVVYDREMSEYDYSGLMAGVTNEVRRTGFMGESLFTAALLGVTDAAEIKAGYLTGHGEPPLEDDSQRGYKEFAQLLRNKNIALQPVSLLGTNELPADLRLLVVAGVRDRLEAGELARMDKFLSSGGRLFVLLDSLVPATGLEQLLAGWGVAVGAGLVFDPANTQNGQDLFGRNFAGHAITRPLLASRGIHLSLPRLVEKASGSGGSSDAAKAEELVRTGPEGVAITSIRDGVPYRMPTDRTGELPLAVAVEKGGVEGVKGDRGATRIVVVGESSFLGNQLIESLANRDFASLSVNWLLDRGMLMGGIGPRPITEYRLMMSREQVRSLRWILLGAIPGGVLLIGLLVWFRRRA